MRWTTAHRTAKPRSAAIGSSPRRRSTRSWAIAWRAGRLEGGREKYIRLTEAGAAFARRALDAVYALEDAAFARTLSRFSPEFVAALADFAQELNAETARFLTEPPQKP